MRLAEKMFQGNEGGGKNGITKLSAIIFVRGLQLLFCLFYFYCFFCLEIALYFMLNSLIYFCDSKVFLIVSLESFGRLISFVIILNFSNIQIVIHVMLYYSLNLPDSLISLNLPLQILNISNVKISKIYLKYRFT